MGPRTKIFTICIIILAFQFTVCISHVAAMDALSEMEGKAIYLVKRLISQENDRDIEAQLHLYADKAEIGGRLLSIDEIQKELTKYYERWPLAEWTLLEEPLLKKIDDTRSEVAYKAKYRLESSPRKKWSSGLIFSRVGLVVINGELRISYIRDVISDVRNGEFFEEGLEEETASTEASEPTSNESSPSKENPTGARPMEALLIANSDYSNFPKLGSPRTDALTLDESLRKLGFATRLVENASREQMLDEIKAFEDRLKNTRAIAFFHFGGHGIQVDGANYLIPADADIPDERRVSTRAVQLNEVMHALDASGSEVNIVVLDACRDNPLPASTTRSATRGLAVVGSKPKNSIVIYAAEAGSKANDGLFTPVLARELVTPGKSLSEIMNRVRKEVNERSGGTQIPGEYSQLFEPVYFGGQVNQTASPEKQNVIYAETKVIEAQSNHPHQNVFGIDLDVYPETKIVNFPKGYRLYDHDGNCIEKVNDSASIQISAESSGRSFARKTAYLSEWSYRKLLEGKKPNWIINVDEN